jgi:hypothetical protein
MVIRPSHVQNLNVYLYGIRTSSSLNSVPCMVKVPCKVWRVSLPNWIHSVPVRECCPVQSRLPPPPSEPTVCVSASAARKVICTPGQSVVSCNRKWVKESLSNNTGKTSDMNVRVPCERTEHKKWGLCSSVSRSVSTGLGLSISVNLLLFDCFWLIAFDCLLLQDAEWGC